MSETRGAGRNFQCIRVAAFLDVAGFIIRQEKLIYNITKQEGGYEKENN